MQVQMGNYTTVSEYCRYLIESGDLASKLAPPKTALGNPLEMDRPESCLLTAPGRETRLQMSGDAPKLPKMNQLTHKTARAKCLHRFAHHELQAVELFAWAILRWPHMPEALKKGFLNTIAEEQKHLKLYLLRLKAHGVSFGDLPLSDYFWRHVPTLDQSPKGPQAFLSAMGLTLEQANLDFTLMFKKAFEDAGDHETAHTLQIVHDDEIGHVRLAKTWLNKLENNPHDLQNYEKTVPFPFGPTRAKGRQFFVEPRKAALLDDEFIKHIQEAQKEWVKKPMVLYPNFGAEEAHKAKNKEHFYAIKILFEAFWQTNAAREDLHPALRQPNPLLPQNDTLLLFPWLANDAAQTKANQQERLLWGPTPLLVEKWHSKSHALKWAQSRGFHPKMLESQITFIPPDFFNAPLAEERLKEKIETLMGEAQKPITLKPNWGFSGRGRAGSENIAHFNKILGATKRMCHRQKGALLEPWLSRTADYSLLLWLHEGKPHEIKIMRLHNSTSGMYCGHSLNVPAHIIEALTRVADTLSQDLRADGYVGPVSVDAFTFSHESGEQLRAVVEINARMTMGHLAWWTLSYFKDAHKALFAFHPKLQDARPDWAKETHLLFEGGPLVFCG